MPIRKGNEDEPRDEQGRWTSGGSSSSGSSMPPGSTAATVLGSHGFGETFKNKMGTQYMNNHTGDMVIVGKNGSWTFRERQADRTFNNTASGKDTASLHAFLANRNESKGKAAKAGGSDDEARDDHGRWTSGGGGGGSGGGKDAKSGAEFRDRADTAAEDHGFQSYDDKHDQTTYVKEHGEDNMDALTVNEDGSWTHAHLGGENEDPKQLGSGRGAKSLERHLNTYYGKQKAANPMLDTILKAMGKVHDDLQAEKAEKAKTRKAGARHGERDRALLAAAHDACAMLADGAHCMKASEENMDEQNDNEEEGREALGKRGARHSKEDLGRIKAAHDALCAAGAVCPGMRKDDEAD